MRIFDQDLADLVRAGKVEEALALQVCYDEAALRRALRGVKSTGEGVGLI